MINSFTVENKQMTMKNKILIMFGMLAAGLLAGCSGDDVKTDAEKASDAAKSYTDKAVDEGKHAWDEVKDFSIEQKDALVKAVNEASSATATEFSRLRAKSATLTGDAKVKAERALDELKAATDNLGKEVAKLGPATKDGWEATRDGVVKAWDEVKKAAEKAKNAIDG